MSQIYERHRSYYSGPLARHDFQLEKVKYIDIVEDGKVKTKNKFPLPQVAFRLKDILPKPPHCELFTVFSS